MATSGLCGNEVKPMEEEARRHAKPMLTTEEQVERLKARGVKFELCKEAEARAYLEQKCYPFKVLSYRKLFDKHVGGEKDGQYVSLDFDQLKVMARLDQDLRELMLDMTLDIEHFESTRLLNEMAKRDEDGYSIVSDYLDSLSDNARAYIERELSSRSRDEYSGRVISKYDDDMPAWAFVGVVSFGSFIGFVRFCADRWDDKELSRRHYQLKHAKSVRNSCAHGACILNDLERSDDRSTMVGTEITSVLSRHGVSKRERKARLASPRMRQITTTLFLYATVVPAGATKEDRVERLSKLYASAESAASVMQEANPAIASLRFMKRLTGHFGLLQ